MAVAVPLVRRRGADDMPSGRSERPQDLGKRTPPDRCESNERVNRGSGHTATRNASGPDAPRQTDQKKAIKRPAEGSMDTYVILRRSGWRSARAAATSGPGGPSRTESLLLVGRRDSVLSAPS